MINHVKRIGISSTQTLKLILNLLTKSLKRGTVITSEKDTPQPACALQEFVKHIADRLVNKGWNLHLNFGKGESQADQFVQGSSPWESTANTDKQEKVSKPQIGRQIPLEMGTGGGGGGGKKGGNGDKKPPEDRIDIEDYPGEGEEDDSSSETSLELNLDPQQLGSVGLDRPLLKLRLTPKRRRRIVTAPGGGRTPPPMGGGTVTVPLPERQNGTGINQPIESGGGPPQLPNGVGGGTGPLLSKRDRRIPQQPAGGAGAPPPGGNGNGNGGGDRPPRPRRNGGNGENLGRTMVDVLAMQQQANLTLQDQIRRANDAQMDQTLAMDDLADITEQRTYDSMFAAVPIYHGKDDENFNEWADQLEALCEISH